MNVVVYRKGISILLANEPNQYKRSRFVSSDHGKVVWSVETLGRECNSTGFCVYLPKPE